MTHTIDEFSTWFIHEQAGQYLLTKEYEFFQLASKETFGQVGVQLGLPQIPFIKYCKTTHCLITAEYGQADIICKNNYLPFAPESIDVIFMPHTLEFHAHPHHVLNEVWRALRPEGRLILTGFNPLSMWCFAHYYPHCTIPSYRQRLSLNRLKDWLHVLGFDIQLGQFLVYVPYSNQASTLKRWHFMELAGNRWFPHLSVVYALVVIKRVYGMRLLDPNKKSFHIPLLLPDSKAINKYK